MRTTAVRWTALQRGVIEATKASLGVGRSDRPLPRDIEGLLVKLQAAAADPQARLEFITCLAGPAKAGVASVNGRLAIFDAGMFAAIAHMDQAIANAQSQARSDPDFREIVEHRQAQKRTLSESAQAVRDQVAKGE